jgi:hypothetical protein
MHTTDELYSYDVLTDADALDGEIVWRAVLNVDIRSWKHPELWSPKRKPTSVSKSLLSLDVCMIRNEDCDDEVPVIRASLQEMSNVHTVYPT